ncbi:unnamed protein product [Lactuca saligna]|uniref:TAFII28-like protein domain-containing protein n=1 Tax=Lactuca saligna TaxID=75948 RepID=A0AA36EA45_LACSI|nr:unnamed protein product [Lactuca saligna]
MKQPKDPFEVAFEELDESLVDSPDTHDEIVAQTLSSKPNINSQRDDLENNIHPLNKPKSRETPKKCPKCSQYYHSSLRNKLVGMNRRSGFQKLKMKRLLANITGSAKISMPMNIVVSEIAKIFVGELVETGCVSTQEVCGEIDIKDVEIEAKHQQMHLLMRLGFHSLKQVLKVPPMWKKLLWL